MKKVVFVSLGIASLAICIVLSTAESLAIGADSAKSQVDVLFQQALAADQVGNSALRDRLLADVLAQDPDHKLARWHSGQVLHNGKWQTLDTVERLVANNPRWQEYRSRVESREDSLAAHAELARWCRTQGLMLEEQWHWINVLRHDADNREALGSLGLRPYRGEYLSPEQIAAYEAEETEAKQDFQHYTGLLKSAMREAERSEGTERTRALKRVSGIRDPAAIQAIVEVVLADVKNEKRILSKLGTEKGEKLLRQMQLAAITALSEMPEHEATLRLLELALYASDSEVRFDAAHSLKYRELTDFVPLLMAGLSMPIEYSIRLNMLSNGQVLLTEDYHETGPLAESNQFHSSTYSTKLIRGKRSSEEVKFYKQIRQPVRPIFVYNNPQLDWQKATSKAGAAEQQVVAENELREQRNARIEQILSSVTGQKVGDNPKAWWTAWMQFNELYTPERVPVFNREIENDYSYTDYRPLSCFVAGTPVWTQSGPVAIEKVKIGDLVLSQDPHTGELNYRPVVDTTVRPPSGTVKLDFNNETITTTRGHRFWIAGQGWEMAKFLQPGSQLVAVSGSIDLQSAEAGEEAEAYNLEVGQFHTYFVGRCRVLVHDNTCPQPTINTLPGVSPRAAFAPQLALRN